MRKLYLIPVIASGGAGRLEHFYDALTEGGADAALAASLFHYKELEIMQVKDYLAQRRRSGKEVSIWQRISNDWLPVFQGEFRKPYYKQLYQTVMTGIQYAENLSGAGRYFQCVPADAFS